MISASTDELDDSRRWHVLQYRRQQIITVQAVELFRSHGIEPLVIKGVAAARYYPAGAYRISIDVDLAVSEADLSRARELLDTAPPPFSVDLHRELRHLDTVPWDDLVTNSVTLPLPDGEVRVLRPEDDLRLLAVHWLTDGGAYKDRLWDIYHLIDSRDGHFEWDRCLDIVDERRRRWIDCAAGVAARYLGLDLDGTPLARASRRLPKWLVRTLEREWASKTTHIPLEATVRDRQLFVTQLLSRMRPNPIHATIDCEGSLDARTRLHYQIRNGVRRIIPSYRRVTSALGVRR